MTATILFKNGSSITAEQNGSCFIIDTKPTFPSPLGTVTIEGEEPRTIEHAQLVECASIDGRYWFSFIETPQDELKCVGKQVTIPAKAEYVNVTADTIDGYSFVCWLSVATDGFVGSAYAVRPESAQTDIWIFNGAVNWARQIYVTALYSKL